jgi:hypothetical protein
VFSRQAPSIHTALWQGGLSPAQASEVQNLVGQCRATLVHRGPISVDPTTPSMRLIDPESAKTKFPQIGDLLPPEHKKKPPKNVPPEEKPQPQPQPILPEPEPVGPAGPEADNKGKNLKAGDYIEIKNEEIHLKHKDFRDGKHCIFNNGFVRGVAFKAQETSTENDGDQVNGNHIVVEWLDNRPNETILEYGLKNLKAIRVVTGVDFYPNGVPGETGTEPVFRFTNTPVLAWLGEGLPGYYDVPLAKCKTTTGGTGP